ncbi:MAG: putative 4-hydroxy-4-methyl-2-oxoglutarate aldolase, partial [bacterium]
DKLAQIAVDNRWCGIVINGCIRDSAVIATIAIGLKALNTIPKKSIKKGQGEVDIPLEFAGVIFNPGDFLYADSDGIILSQHKLI